jgi:peptidase S41-like protein
MMRVTPVVTACWTTLTLVSAPLHGQVSIPNTPAGRALRAWLDAYNSGDSARVATFFRTYAVEDALRGAFTFRRMTGGIDVLSVPVSEPRHLEFMTRFRSGPMVGYGALDVSSGDTSRLSGYLFPLGLNVSANDIRIDAPNRERVVGRLAALLDSFYVSPEVGRRMSDSLHARLRRGVYNRYTNGASLAIHLRADLDEIAHDKHLQILYTLLVRGPEPPAATAPPQRRESEANCPVWTTERLEGNVGYLRFDGFIDPADCGVTIVRAMNALAETNALIIDLRENAGGGKAGSTPLLESYLFDRRTHLSDVSFRKTGEIRERWTLDSVAGARFGGVKPVVLLTSAHTLSAAEELAYDLQALKRATIVGETTSGQAHATFEARIDSHFEILLPTGKTVNPVTGADWEGVGVIPDVKVPATDALATAKRLLREKMPQ